MPVAFGFAAANGYAAFLVFDILFQLAQLGIQRFGRFGKFIQHGIGNIPILLHVVNARLQYSRVFAGNDFVLPDRQRFVAMWALVNRC